MWDTGGIVKAYDLQTGAYLWNCNASGSSGYDDPRGIYEFFGYNTHAIADGKLFLQEGFMYTPPLHPLDQFSSKLHNRRKLVWDILQATAHDLAVLLRMILLQEWDSYDCKIYTYGMGATATTVTAPTVGVTTSTPVTITGTVMDISAGAKQKE